MARHASLHNTLNIIGQFDRDFFLKHVYNILSERIIKIFSFAHMQNKNIFIILNLIGPNRSYIYVFHYEYGRNYKHESIRMFLVEFFTADLLKKHPNPTICLCRDICKTKQCFFETFLLQQLFSEQEYLQRYCLSVQYEVKYFFFLFKSLSLRLDDLVALFSK